MMGRVLMAGLGLLAIAAAAHAAVEIRLTPSPSEAPTPQGFMPGRLVVADPNSELPQAVRALTIRRAAGGPTVFYEASVAPGTSGEFRVAWPMVSVRETCVVSLLGEASPDGPVLLSRKVAALTDDVDAVEAIRAGLIDPPSYDDYIEALPRWPARVVRGVCLCAAGLLVALGAAMLIRGPAWRTVSALVAVTAATGAVYAVVSSCPAVEVRQIGDLLVVSSRRTVAWSHPAGEVAPVYRRARQMNADDMIVQPDKTLTVTIRPDEVRLFRRQEE